MEPIIEEIYNFSFQEQTLQDFKSQIMRDLTPKQIEALIEVLSKYIQVTSTYEMHKRIYDGKHDETFEDQMRGIKKLQEDLGSLLKKIGQK